MATLKKYLPCAPGHRSHHGEQQTFYMKFVNLIVLSWLPVIAKCGLTMISGFESAVLQPGKMDGSAQSKSSPASTQEELRWGWEWGRSCWNASLVRAYPCCLRRNACNWGGSSHRVTPTLTKFQPF